MFAAGNAAAAQAANYIEDVFSTYLYTGNGSTQTITNGIDLSGKGGMVWSKRRNSINSHYLSDTFRGVDNNLSTDTTDGASASSNNLTSFNNNGFSVGSSSNWNGSSNTYASWTFRKQPKFFDVVTYTGNGANRTIAHNLGSTPGCIIIKRTDTTSNWQVYHRSLTSAAYGIQLNLTNAQASDATLWNSTAPTSSVFSLGTNTAVNANTGTYVAYLFAHDAGGFGASGTDNVISCGSFTTDGSGNATVSLGYEPQWSVFKASSTTGNWFMVNSMSGWANSGTNGNAARLYANTSAAEAADGVGWPTATGFQAQALVASQTYIYIAIRRGPMKTPTSGTSVFTPQTRNSGTNTTTGIGFAPDLYVIKSRSTSGAEAFYWHDRLRRFDNGGTQALDSSSTAAEFATTNATGGWVYDGATTGTVQFNSTTANLNSSGATWIQYSLRRAPGFFDIVCYTGTGVARTVSHNLSVIPEFIIVKDRSNARNWVCYAAPLGATNYIRLNQTAAAGTYNVWGDTTPTSSVFYVDTYVENNGSAETYVAYLFASCPGVSKVGSYTGNGSSQTINCGFTNGARFVLIKRTDSTGDWYVFDSARGIVAGNDPYLLLNSTAAEVTTYDAVDTDSTGFIVNNDNTNYPINVNTATYIYLAIA